MKLRGGGQINWLFAGGVFALLVTLLTYKLVNRSKLTSSQLRLEEQMEVAAVRYFTDNTNPTSGLVRDWAENFAPEDIKNRSASLAATGFGLATIINAGQRGFVSKEYAEAYALKTLRFVRDHVRHYKGWLLHFVDWETGARTENSEYSTIDTALFLAGAIYAGQIYPNTEVAALAFELYNRTDFTDMMTDGGAHPEKRTLSLQYTAEQGYSEIQWAGYSEEPILYILGLGHPTHPLPSESWLSFRRKKTVLPDGSVLIGRGRPLFIHQYPQLFLDLRNFEDSYGNYFANSILATRYNRETCLSDPHFKTFREGFWGLSAGESIQGYSVYSPLHYDGTVCLGCVVASAMFLPKQIMSDVEGWMNGPYRKKIWGRFGLVDSLNLDQDWFAQKVLGITVGPLYLSLSNMNEKHSIWAAFNQIPEIQRALQRAKNAHLDVPPH